MSSPHFFRRRLTKKSHSVYYLSLIIHILSQTEYHISNHTHQMPAMLVNSYGKTSLSISFYRNAIIILKYSLCVMPQLPFLDRFHSVKLPILQKSLASLTLPLSFNTTNSLQPKTPLILPKEL